MNENASRALAYAAAATQLAARAARDALRLTNDPAAWPWGTPPTGPPAPPHRPPAPLATNGLPTTPTGWPTTLSPSPKAPGT